MWNRLLTSAVIVAWAFTGIAFAQPGPKPGATFYTATARANAKANAVKYDWAKKQVDDAIAAAKPWLEMSDDALYDLIIPPKLKRAIMVNVKKGCPSCGMGIYGQRGARPYVWAGRVEGHPWKVQCPNCKELFPKNDFSKFFQSGINPETGLFEPERGDRSLLFNTDHPDPNDPKHTYGVDDGEGWARHPGSKMADRDFFIAYHVYHGRASRMTAAIRSLAQAFALTGEPIYAHKCAIMFDRMADVYPNYDGGSNQLFNNVWGRYSDGILGPSYWAGGGWAQRAIDYDMIYDGIGQMPETLAFIQAKARQYKVPVPKTSIADVRRSIEQRVLYENSKPANYKRIHMNGSITEMCLAKVDLVLRGDQAKQEFAGKHMPLIVPDRFLNNDGSGNERSTGYDGGAFGSYCSLIEQLYQLDRDLFQRIIEGYPKLKAAFDFWADIWCVEKYIPQIGDVGEPGATSGLRGTPGAYLALFDVTGNTRYAQVALRMVDGDATKLPRNIYADDPEGLITRAVQANTNAGTWTSPSVIKPNYKLAILRGKEGGTDRPEGEGPKGLPVDSPAGGTGGSPTSVSTNPIALWLFYSPNGGTSSHSHYDALNLGLYAFGLSMICEQGYPQFTGGWPARGEWTSNTRSHATVTVDDNGQKHCDGGKLLAFAQADGVQMISAEAPCATDPVSLYRRTMLLVDTPQGNHLIIDVFRVKGGRKHTYTVPIFYGDLTSQGLTFTSHPDVYGHYIEKARSAPADNPWYVDAAIRTSWEGEPAAHLRIHGPADKTTVITGQGETRYGKDVPQRLPYLLIQRQSGTDNLTSTFVVVYEPYRTKPFVKHEAIRLAQGPDNVTVGIELAEAETAYHITINDRNADNIMAEVATQMFDRTTRITLGGVAKQGVFR